MEKRSVVVVGKAGIVGVQSVDMVRFQLVTQTDGSVVRSREMRPLTYEYDEKAMNAPMAVLQTVTSMIKSASEDAAWKGGRINFFTLQDTAYRGREIVSKIVKLNLSAEAAVKDSLAKTEARTGKPAAEGYAEALMEFAEAIVAAKKAGIFLSFDDVTDTSSRQLKTTQSGTLVTQGLANLQEVIAQAWLLCPRDVVVLSAAKASGVTTAF